MKILSWNIRGLGTTRNVLSLKEILKEVSPVIIFLFETKIKNDRLEEVKLVLDLHHHFQVPALGACGRIHVLWRKNIDLSIQSYS